MADDCLMNNESANGTSPAARLAFEAAAVTAASLELNGVPSVRALVIHASSRLHGCTVRLAIDDSPAPPYERGLEPIEPGGSLALDVSDFTLPLPLLQRSTERESVDLLASLVDGSERVLASSRHRLIVLPASHWCGASTACESLATFVTPNAPALRELLLAASRTLEQRTGSGALDGYQSESPERAQRIAEACYEALAARGLVYITARPSFEEAGQKVRTATDCLADGAGNCLDLSLALAALLEASGLAPVILIGDGHAIVGFFTIDEPFADAVHEGPSRVVNRLDLGEIRVLEATGACAARLSFAQALAEGEQFLRRATDAVRVLDLPAARRAGYHPLPERLAEAGAQSPDTRRPVRSAAWTVVQPADLPPLPSVRRPPHERRLDQWKKRLLDLTLRNRLLNDRPATGISLLPSGDGVLAHLEQILRNTKPLRLVPQGSMRVPAEAAMVDELDRGWLRAGLDEVELFRRATKAYRDGRNSIDETGARSLYIGLGFLEYRGGGHNALLLAPLILVPISMERLSRIEGFRVAPVDEAALPNLALVEYFRTTFGVDLGLGMAETDEASPLDVPALLARVRKAICDVPGARVLSEAKLGNYSFKKLPLFEEMRERSSFLTQHPIVRTLLDGATGDLIRRIPLVSPGEVDQAVSFQAVHLPLPADSSQIAAVCSAAAGATFVLQGPPGTGKSQTITNLLSECLARGQRVLFVAEKAAALEVVSNRLHLAGLGTFALDLHADHATKTAFVDQIKRSFEDLEAQGVKSQRPGTAAVASALDRSRDQLAATCAALHQERGEGFIAHEAIQRAVELTDSIPDSIRTTIDSTLESVLPPAPTAADLGRCMDAAETLARAAERLPPGAAARFDDLSPSRLIPPEEAAGIASAAREAATLADSAARAGAELATLLGLGRPGTWSQLTALQSIGAALSIESPGASHIVETALGPDHAARSGSLRRSIEACARAQAAEADVLARYDRAVLGLPIAEYIGDLRARRESFALLRWLATRKVRGKLLRLAKSPPPTHLPELLTECERLQESIETIQAAQAHQAAITPLLGAERAFDPDRTRAALEAAQRAGELIRATFADSAPSAATAAARVAGTPALTQSTHELGDLLARIQAALGLLDDRLKPEPPLATRGSELASLAGRLQVIAQHAGDLPAWSACAIARSRAAELGLASISRTLLTAPLDPDLARTTTEGLLLGAWTRARLRDDMALAASADEKLDDTRRRFVSDLGTYQARVAKTVAASVRSRARATLATAGSNDDLRRALRTVQELRGLSIIRRSIRRVMRDGAPVIAALKPIVLASPLSAASLLPPEFPPFDLVVFDEASQIPVWDAACAIARGAACVIVGDSRQLPPTDFFERKDGGDSGTENDDDLADALAPRQSLLEEAVAAGIPERSLLWHYRSRDERLIEFSNRKSYGSRLKTFPAPHRSHPNLGVEFRFVAGTYDRGGSATNRAEAEAVVAEIARRLLDDDACSTHRSIGVVTFSQAQQTLVQDLLDDAVDQNPQLRARMAEAADSGEPLFVKNLENVQGDERATLLFSICYGRDSSGALHHHFGPLNLAGGERRLNVAVTRAREKVVVFSSIRSRDLDPARCFSQGALDLRDYLAYAELGTIPVPHDDSTLPHTPEAGPIEQAMARALEARGHRVDLHVGRSHEYRVSLALVDPATPQRWKLGIELDGVFHGTAPTVLDREAVRPGVLRVLGWKTLRVSCLDWFLDPVRTVERIERALGEP